MKLSYCSRFWDADESCRHEHNHSYNGAFTVDFRAHNGLFPPPNGITWVDEGFTLNESVCLSSGIELPEAACTWVVDALEARGVAVNLSDTPLEGCALVLHTEGDRAPEIPTSVDLAPEGYLLNVSRECAIVVGKDPRGGLYGADSLARLIICADGVIPGCCGEDAPVMTVRGVHTFLPGRDHLEYYLRLLEFLARYRYNTLYLETAGGMELEKHPEINRAWEQFAQELMAHPRAQKGLQESQWFDWKDDPHVELASGSWLTKDEVRQIVNKARELGIEIVPEVQALAHCYYLTTAHPEIAEAQDDPFPDSYCPSNPKSYELLFDVMEEVIEVFEPGMIHIGHDEVYTLRRCPECRKRSAANIFADEVTKLHDWLAERGVRTAMWCDKFLNLEYKGERLGGVLRRVYKGKKQWVMPPTYKAVDKVPTDIRLLDWYWMFNNNTAKEMAERGFDEIVYGNFQPTGMQDWVERREYTNVLGAEISTWVGAEEAVFGGNMSLIHQFIEGSCTLWNHDYDPAKDTSSLVAHVQTFIPAERDFLGNRTSLLTQVRTRAAEAEAVAFPPIECLAFNGNPVENLGTGSMTLGSYPFIIPEKDGRPGCVTARWYSAVGRVPIEDHVKGLILLIATSITKSYRSRNDELHMGKDVVGRLHFHYGNTCGNARDYGMYDLVYGDNICSWAATPRSYWSDPIPAGTADGKPVTAYAVEWLNPKPELFLKQIDLIWLGGRTDEGEICLLGMSKVK